MTFEEILDEFARRVEAAEYERFAELFTGDGVYDDIFYGVHTGRAEIADMLRRFHAEGEDFKWEMSDPAEAGGVGYARWLFSFTARHERAGGKRVTFEGVGVYHLRDGLIARYEDFCNGAVPLVQMNTPPGLLEKMIERWQRKLEQHPDFAAHQS